jgi:hypothetical protein
MDGSNPKWGRDVITFDLGLHLCSFKIYSQIEDPLLLLAHDI